MILLMFGCSKEREPEPRFRNRHVLSLLPELEYKSAHVGSQFEHVNLATERTEILLANDPLRRLFACDLLESLIFPHRIAQDDSKRQRKLCE